MSTGDIEKELQEICDEADLTMKLARWMIDNSFATGHGDTFDDLLKELTRQIKELRQK
jgi:hypothetical protein